MAVRLRLRRMGRKKRPFYRIVAADQRSPRDGRFIEKIGYYDPLQNPHEINLDEERVTYWLGKGAQPSRTVRNLLQQKGVLHRIELKKKGLSEEEIEIEMKKWELLQIERRKRKEAAMVQKKKEKAEKAAEVEEVKKEESEEKTETKTEDIESGEKVEDKVEDKVETKKVEEKVETEKVEEKAEVKAEESEPVEKNETSQESEAQTEPKVESNKKEESKS